VPITILFSTVCAWPGQLGGGWPRWPPATPGTNKPGGSHTTDPSHHIHIKNWRTDNQDARVRVYGTLTDSECMRPGIFEVVEVDYCYLIEKPENVIGFRLV
jgi:hypothetical protein